MELVERLKGFCPTFGDARLDKHDGFFECIGMYDYHTMIHSLILINDFPNAIGVACKEGECIEIVFEESQEGVFKHFRDCGGAFVG